MKTYPDSCFGVLQEDFLAPKGWQLCGNNFKIEEVSGGGEVILGCASTQVRAEISLDTGKDFK